MLYKPKYFSLQELVSPNIYGYYGDRAWRFLDHRILRAADIIRGLVDCPCVINTWSLNQTNAWWKDNRFSSGYRNPLIHDHKHYLNTGQIKIIIQPDHYYNPTSQHSHGRAVDMLCRDHTAEQLRQIVYKNRDSFFGLITGIEDGVSWLHIDCGNRTPNHLDQFYLFSKK